MADASRNLEIRWLGDAKDLIRAADQAKRALGDTDQAATKAGGESGGVALLRRGAVALGGAFAVSRFASFIGDARDLGIAAEEAGNKFNAVFGPAADQLGTSLEALGDKAGIADFDLENMVGTLGNILIGMGATTDQAASFSASIAPLAVDIASFNGEVGNSPEVLAAIGSALTGERERLKQYGIVVHEADVVQRALADSGKAAAAELTQLEKAQATLTLITERSGAAMGDLDRNLDSAATKQAQATAAWREAQAELGTKLLPVLTQLTPVAVAFAEALGFITAPLGLIGQSARDAAADVGVLQASMDAIGNIQPDLLAQTFNIPEKDIDRLARAGSSLEEVAAELKKGPESFAAWSLAMVQSADQTQITRGELEQLQSSLMAMGVAYEDAKALVQASDEGFQDYLDTVGRTGSVLTPAKSAHDDLTSSIDDATAAQYAQIDAMRAAADPFFRARQSANRYKESIGNVNDAINTYGVNSPEHLNAVAASGQAYLTLKSDLATLNESGYAASEQAIRNLFTEMGYSGDAVDAMIDDFLRWLDVDLDRNATVYVDVVTYGTGGQITPIGGYGYASAPAPPPEWDNTTRPDLMPDIGKAVTMSTVINVNGFVGSESELANAIDDVLTRKARTSGLGFT